MLPKKQDILTARTWKIFSRRMVERFCTKMNYPLKWVEKYVTSFDDKSGQEYMNNLQATVQAVMDHPQWRLSLQTHRILGIK